MAEIKKQRSANIELLRIFAMAGVIFLHYYNAQMGGAIEFVEKASLNEWILRTLESINICAVDVFVIITGYFLSKTNTRAIGRVMSLVLQVMLYRLAIFAADIIVNKGGFSWKGLVHAALPVNWFVILYVVLYLVSPLINKALVSLPEKGVSIKKVAIGTILLFSIWPTLVDVVYQITGNELQGLSTLGMYGSERGYTIVNFIMCYILGLYLSSIDIKRIKMWLLIILLPICAAVLTIWGYYNSYTAYEYCNPILILEAVIVFLLFAKIEIRDGVFARIITTISACAFSVYLLHKYFLTHLRIKDYVKKTPGVMVLHILVCIIGIIVICFAVDWVYKIIMKFINKKLRDTWKYTVE